MNQTRRGFLKFFGIGLAATAAAPTLIGTVVHIEEETAVEGADALVYGGRIMVSKQLLADSTVDFRYIISKQMELSHRQITEQLLVAIKERQSR